MTGYTRKLLPAAAFCLALLLVALAAASLDWLLRRSGQEQFAASVQELHGRIERSIGQSGLLLSGTLALFHVHPHAVDHATFRSYTERSQLSQTANGMQGIGFARRTTAAEAGEVERAMRSAYGEEARVWPPIEEEGFPIVLLEPRDERNLAAIGFDMFSRPDRRAAMERARDTGAPTASKPVELVQEIDSRPIPGFLVYLPYYGGGPTPIDIESRRERLRGFVYAPYRGEDFFEAALRFAGPSPIRVRVHDAEAGEAQPLYDSQSGGADETPLFNERRTIQVGGRTWVLDYTSAASFRTGLETSLIGIVLVLGLMLAAATGILVFFQMRALEQAEREIASGVRAQAEKDLLLQEMKHRIKNSLARVAALARQTARTAPSIEEFVKSFEARIQAMSATQDLLTRSKWEQVSLRGLLETELAAGLGEDRGKYALEGPDVIVGARQALGLGLSFHELATNALKYGGLAEPEGSLRVSWSVSKSPAGDELVIDWVEQGTQAGEPQPAGFGSRLIDISIEGELGGRVMRDYRPDGLRARLSVPLKDGPT